jgi:hypothetical protein
MAEKTSLLTPGIDSRGGYTGDQPAASVGPPEPIPSATIKPPPAVASKTPA